MVTSSTRGARGGALRCKHRALEYVARPNLSRDLIANPRLIAQIEASRLLKSIVREGQVESTTKRSTWQETHRSMTDHVPYVLDGHDSSGAATLKGASDTHRLLHRPGTGRPNTRPFPRNVILSSISLQELAAIGEFLEPVVLRERMMLQEPKKHLDHLYFIESGLISLRIVAGGSILETALIGHQGALGASLLVGGHLATHQSVVLFPGSAHRIRVEDLRRVVRERPEIRERLVQYAQALSLHCAQTGLCGVRHDREKRLACWLCLANDAFDADVLPITHDYLSSMLGLRRAGVTETLIRFEQQGLICKSRGVLRIGERRSLEQKACSCYRLIAGAYASTEPALSIIDTGLKARGGLNPSFNSI